MYGGELTKVHLGYSRQQKLSMTWTLSFAVAICAFLPCSLAQQVCVCNSTGSLNATCDPLTNECLCKPGVAGEQCDRCLPGYYSFSDSGCLPCDCNQDGILRTDTCDPSTGQCECALGVSGLKCDTCPPGSIGPSGKLATRCINCFCNGFTTECVSDEGWYQAKVVNSFLSESEKEGFRTNGIVKANTTGYIEVEPSKDPDSLVVTFPPDYLGDKRTSYGQELQLNLSLTLMNQNDSSEAMIEISGRPHRNRREKLLLPIPPLGTEPQLYKLQLSPGDMIIDLSYASHLASEEDIREILANILTMKLILTFPSDNGATRRIFRLYETALPYATDSQTDVYLQQPLENVSYVEVCTCPENRMGQHCGLCASGYTMDPAFGGEFARCVSCFCSFHSDTCNPVTGMCFNCSDNTVGPSCEQCIEGYQQSVPITIAPCDECADGYWDPGNGSCIPCGCHPNGSLSLTCNKETGVCDCKEGVTGNQCDTCHKNTTGFFPSCELCDECTTQWQDRIVPLQVEVESTIEFIMTLNLTNITSSAADTEALFELVEEIKVVLNLSQIDMVSEETQSTHALLCNISNQIQVLIERAVIVEQQLDSADNTTLHIQSEVTRIRELLVELQSEFENISQSLPDLTFFNTSFYLMLTEEALDQSDQAEQTIQVNVSSTLSEAQDVLSNFAVKLNESQFIGIQQNNTLRLQFLSERLSDFESLIAEASLKLCGALLNGSCEECGGLNCTMCGGPTCNSLVTDASEAANISSRALQIAQDALGRIQNQTQELESLLRDINVVRNDSISAEMLANQTLVDAERLLKELQELIIRVEDELRKDPPDFEEIESRENMTLDIELVVTPEEFQELLEMINATIDAFFSNVSEGDLRQRAQNALDRANRSNDLAVEVVANATDLDNQLQQLQSQADQAEATANETEEIITSTENKLNQSNLLLDDAEEELVRTQELVSNLTSRLLRLQGLIEENRRNLEEARNVTHEAVNIADSVERESIQVEASFNDLQNATNAKFQQSEEDLEFSLSLQNRTNTLQITAQQQLLDIENLEHVRDSLVQEQEEIRSDIERIANELERLFEEIQVRIAKNTACLDVGTLN